MMILIQLEECMAQQILATQHTVQVFNSRKALI